MSDEIWSKCLQQTEGVTTRNHIMVFVTVIVVFNIPTPNLNWEINGRRSLTEYHFDPKAVHFHSVKLDTAICNGLMHSKLVLDNSDGVCFVVMIG